MMMYYFLGHVVDALANELTPYRMRFGVDFDGPKVPFGAGCKYRPSSKDDRLRIPYIGKQMLEGIVVGSEQKAGGQWSGKIYVADKEELIEAEQFHDAAQKIRCVTQ